MTTVDPNTTVSLAPDAASIKRPITPHRSAGADLLALALDDTPFEEESHRFRTTPFEGIEDAWPSNPVADRA